MYENLVEDHGPPADAHDHCVKLTKLIFVPHIHDKLELFQRKFIVSPSKTFLNTTD